MTVIGDDYVGGLFGRFPHDMILTDDESNITLPYTVIGRYAVGGLVGMHASENNGVNAQGRDKMQILFLIMVLLLRYTENVSVGGILGYSSSEPGRYPSYNKVKLVSISIK